MPEGPEVRTVARTLSENISGKILGDFWYSHKKLRTSVNITQLEALRGKEITRVSSYGKVIFLESYQEPIIFAQLGMTGQLYITSKLSSLLAHTHIRWPLINSTEELRYVDPRRFGVFNICSKIKQNSILKKLGPDPFNFVSQDINKIISNISKSSRAIKNILLDQKIIAGVGNIYASESLFLSKIHPETCGSKISKKKLLILIRETKNTLENAYKNCGTTFSNYVDGSGQAGNNISYLKVFQKTGQPCPSCSTPISKITQSGRSTFLCSKCQLYC